MRPRESRRSEQAVGLSATIQGSTGGSRDGALNLEGGQSRSERSSQQRIIQRQREGATNIPEHLQDHGRGVNLGGSGYGQGHSNDVQRQTDTGGEGGEGERHRVRGGGDDRRGDVDHLWGGRGSGREQRPGNGQGTEQRRGGGARGGGGGRGGGRGEQEKQETEREFRQPNPTHPQETIEPETLKIIYTNARSLLSKTDHVAILINDNDPDIILVTETWLNNDIPNSLLNMPGYYIEPELRIDRNDTLNGIGGGLLVYIKNDQLKKIVSVENAFNMFTRFEILCRPSKDDRRSQTKPSLSVTLVYRPPSARHSNTELLLELFENPSENSIIIGDFNFPSINWVTLQADRSKE